MIIAVTQTTLRIADVSLRRRETDNKRILRDAGFSRISVTIVNALTDHVKCSEQKSPSGRSYDAIAWQAQKGSTFVLIIEDVSNVGSMYLNDYRLMTMRTILAAGKSRQDVESVVKQVQDAFATPKSVLLSTSQPKVIMPYSKTPALKTGGADLVYSLAMRAVNDIMPQTSLRASVSGIPMTDGLITVQHSATRCEDTEWILGSDMRNASYEALAAKNSLQNYHSAQPDVGSSQSTTRTSTCGLRCVLAVTYSETANHASIVVVSSPTYIQTGRAGQYGYPAQFTNYMVRII